MKKNFNKFDSEWMRIEPITPSFVFFLGVVGHMCQKANTYREHDWVSMFNLHHQQKCSAKSPDPP